MKYIIVFFTVITTSMYFFPFEFTFLRGINTKHLMFLIGFISFGFDVLLRRELVLTKELFISSILAVIFSLVGFYSTLYNNTTDYAYSTYIASMWMWFLSCYGACYCIRIAHGYISIKLIVNYLLAVCVFQCTMALLIDFIPSVKVVVDSIFITGDLNFMERVERLYGIGASLDVAGVRFASVIVMAIALLCEDKYIRDNKVQMILYIFSILIIGFVGNMMARTTTIGLSLGVVYLLLRSGILALTIKYINIYFGIILFFSVAIVAGYATYLYNTNEDFYELIRFAFEGFFNWVETGNWETDSTDVLKNMWVYPDNLKTWIIGDGYFMDPFSPGYYMQTDVGYLRFIYYCGVIGLSLFSIFFIYLGITLSVKFHHIRYLILFLLAVVFINWIKVSTDIFIVFAFFLVISQPYFEGYYKKDFEEI